MFIIILKYKKPLEFVDQYVKIHRAFLDQCYKNNYFVASGPQNPRTGGVIISHLKDRERLEKILKDDPFYTYEIADYELIEFNPIKYHPDFEKFIGC